MAETEQVVTPEAAAPPLSGEIQEKPADQEGATPTIPKPRFDEVLERAKSAEERAKQAEQRTREIEAKLAVPAAQPTPTLQDVLVAYDKGQITETQKDQWVHYLAKEGAKQEVTLAVTQAAAITKAESTVSDYLKAMPALTDMASEQWRELSNVYRELMLNGYPDNVITQGMALRMAFGPLKGGHNPGANLEPKSRSDTFLEGQGGGGRMSQEPDLLKNIPARQLAYWKSKGYTKGQMIEEAKLAAMRNIQDFRKAKPKKA